MEFGERERERVDECRYGIFEGYFQQLVFFFFLAAQKEERGRGNLIP